MLVRTPLKELEYDEAAAEVEDGAAYVDLRPTQDYLDVHIPGSLALLFEWGPGMAGRARDCVPLSLPMVLLEDPSSDAPHAATSLRGKGFTVVGKLPDGIDAWAARNGNPGSTDMIEGEAQPEGLVLDVRDPGAAPIEGAVSIAIDELSKRIEEVPLDGRIIVVGGYAVRAGLAVGMLERAGAGDIALWRHRRHQVHSHDATS